MLIPKHCSNPNCHRPYITPKGDDIYSEVLVKISTETDARVISICTKCREKYDIHMATNVLKDVMEVEVKRVASDITLRSAQKLALIERYTTYRIEQIGKTIDDIKI